MHFGIRLCTVVIILCCFPLFSHYFLTLMLLNTVYDVFVKQLPTIMQELAVLKGNMIFYDYGGGHFCQAA